MKTMIRKSIWAILFTGTLITADIALAQGVEVTKTTTTEGTVSEFGPLSIFIKTKPGLVPVRHIFSKSMNYVDEEGNPVDVTTMRSGLPVTVYYTKVGDTLIASKIMVRKTETAPSQTFETTQTPTTSTGIISEFGSERLIIQSEASPDPLSYTYGKATTYVDETGAPVSIHRVKSGLPVTVYYTRVGEALVANKVIVRKNALVQTPVIEEKNITTTATTDR